MVIDNETLYSCYLNKISKYDRKLILEVKLQINELCYPFSNEI